MNDSIEEKNHIVLSRLDDLFGLKEPPDCFNVYKSYDTANFLAARHFSGER